jgi:hypothetical protein
LTGYGDEGIITLSVVTMNNTERLFFHTLPRWSGVAVISIAEKLSDMWIRGEKAGHHSGVPYDQDGIDRLRIEILRDFTTTPSVAAFKPGAPIRTVDDLDSDMQRRQQRPMPPDGKLLSKVLPKDELSALKKRWLITSGEVATRSGKKK